MSTVLTDTIKGKTTATNLTIGSTPIVSSSANSMTIRGEGSEQTSIQQGLLKGWCNFTMVSSTAYRDSFNCGTLTDNGTGSATINLTNPFSNDDWAGSMYTNTYGTETTYSNHYAGGFDNRTSSAVRVAAHDGSNSVDSALNDVHFAGDLA